jgi:hypothetical protein
MMCTVFTKRSSVLAPISLPALASLARLVLTRFREHITRGWLTTRQEAIKNEISLPDDEPKLVQLTLDYLYQLDYDFKAESVNGFAAEENQAPSGFAEPESPVAQAIGIFEDLAVAPAQEETAEDSLRSRCKRSKKKKGRYSLVCDQASLDAIAFKSAAIKDTANREFEETELEIHAKLYALADKYGIDDLKDLARAKFAEAASKHWNTSSFPSAIQIAYSSMPDSDQGLRDIVIYTISQHMDLMKKSEIEGLVKKINGLAFGLVESAWGLRRPDPTPFNFGAMLS